MRPALRLLGETRSGERALFLAGAHHPDLPALAVVQPHRGLRKAFACPDWNGVDRFSEVHLLGTRNREETHEYLGLARRALEPGGQLIFVVENSLGADSWRKRLKVSDAISKYHCRLLKLTPDQLPPAGDPLSLRPPYAGADFVSCPGLFSWERLDLGSQTLLGYLPSALTGHGADLGCGPGLLARELLARGVSQLDAIDVDSRAVVACSENCRNDPRLRALCLDLTQEPPPSCYDWVALNPPFHGTSSEERALGVALIRTAVNSLKMRGRLFLVANQHLPYGPLLDALPVRVEQVHRERGYKVVLCQKNA